VGVGNETRTSVSELLLDAVSQEPSGESGLSSIAVTAPLKLFELIIASGARFSEAMGPWLVERDV
jgi:hypothetical protein